MLCNTNALFLYTKLHKHHYNYYECLMGLLSILFVYRGKKHTFPLAHRTYLCICIQHSQRLSPSFIKYVTSEGSRAGYRLLISKLLIAKKTLSLYISLLLGCGSIEKP